MAVASSRFPVLKPWPETRAPPCEARAFAFEPTDTGVPALVPVSIASQSVGQHPRTRASRSVSNASTSNIASPASQSRTAAAPQALSGTSISRSPHAAYLDTIGMHEWKQLEDVYVCSFETTEVYATSMLGPAELAQLALSAPAVTTVFQAAQARGVRVLGIAPAHKRRGKWTPPITGDPPRMYVGPAKPPFREATVFSPPSK